MPPALRWLQQILRKTSNGAQLRLDKRVPPPTFTIASPGPGEGEAMAKAGGGKGSVMTDRRTKHENDIFSHQEFISMNEALRKTLKQLRLSGLWKAWRSACRRPPAMA